MHEYLKPMKNSVFNNAANKKVSKISKSGTSCKDVARDIFADLRVQRKSEEPLQFVVEGISRKKWLEKHKLRGKIGELFGEFFDMIHLGSDFIFHEQELDSYYAQYEEADESDIDKDILADFGLFQKYVAMMREQEGTHGAQRHTHEGQKGSQYIVDRVLEQDGPQEASYLPLGIYLEWDEKLAIYHEEIFKKYMELVHKLTDDIWRIIGRFLGDCTGIRAAVIELNAEAVIDIGKGKKLILSVFPVRGSFKMGEKMEEKMGKDYFQVRMSASIKSDWLVKSTSVSKRDAREHGIHGVRAVEKRLEAHTGSFFAPVFMVEDGYIVEEEFITPGKLIWITKY